MAKIGFIGMGNMGKAILQGALKEFPKTDFVFCAKTEATKLRVHEETGIDYADSNAECANRCKYLILAIKPQFYEEVLNAVRYMLTPDHVIISLAPGRTIDQLKLNLGNDKRIVRVMPNTPAMIGEGMTGISCRKEEFTDEELDVLTRIFSSCGKAEYIEERLMDAVVCASGSSPAFVYMLYLIYKDSDKKAIFLTLGYLSQYAPWLMVTRTVFIYHYFTILHFVTVMLGYSFYKIVCIIYFI